MVCNRCNLVVEGVLQSLNYENAKVSLGEIDFGNSEVSEDQISQIQKALEPLGFELINDRKSKLVETIKKLVIELIQTQDGLQQLKLSDYLTNKIPYEFYYLSRLFSSVENITLERYYILQKTEKAKELIVYDELSLTEISFQLGYSSLAHLSKQFKSITGFSPGRYRELRDTDTRISIDLL